MSGKILISSLLLGCFVLSVSSFFAQTRNRPADFKVTYRTSTSAGAGAAQTNESTTMIKGARERSEQRMGYGYDMVTITQCDLKRTIQVSDSAKKYLINPIETADATPKATPTPPTAPTPATPTRQGGIVTYTSSTIDTGERKEMFGFTARHVKSTTTIQSSPDACSPVNQRMELDGWYIDLNVELDCRLGRPPVVPSRMPARGGCRDQTRFRHEGTGRVGFPLIETMKMYGENGQVMFSTTKEALELSRQPLDSALFDVPAGYTQVMSQQELFATPSVGDIISGRTEGPAAVPSTPPSGAETKKPGSMRIGVAQLNNKTGKVVALDSLRARLMGQLETAGFESIALNGSSQMEADAEAKAKQCDFILLTDLTSLKSSKLGGMFGRVTGVDAGAKTEAKVEFKLYAVGESSPRLQSSATAKEEGEEASAGTAVDSEAKAVISEARKKGRG